MILLWHEQCSVDQYTVNFERACQGNAMFIS